MKMEHEKWQPIPGFDGRYEASNLGRIRIMWYRNRWGSRSSGYPRILRPKPTHTGYLRSTFHTAEGPKSLFFHRLVLETFHGPCPVGREASHLDGDQTNNSISNLRWETPKVNTNRKNLHGTMLRGEHHGSARLSRPEVVEIRRRYAAGATQSGLAHSYGVSQIAISAITRGRTWRHAPGPIVQGLGSNAQFRIRQQVNAPGIAPRGSASATRRFKRFGDDEVKVDL